MNPPANPQVEALLSQLPPIATPPPVSWWPLAPGWWVVLAVVVMTITCLVLWVVKRRIRTAYKRQALKLLQNIEVSQSERFATHMNGLLKQVCLCAYPQRKTEIIRAYGEHWVNFLKLNSRCPLDTNAATALAVAPYQPNIAFDPKALKGTVARWIRSHPKQLPEAADV